MEFLGSRSWAIHTENFFEKKQCLYTKEMGDSKNRGILPPKMDGLFHGKPYEQMDDLGGKTPIFGNTQMSLAVPLKHVCI